MLSGDTISACKFMAEFLGWETRKVGLSLVHVLPMNFKHGLVDEDGKPAIYCTSDKLRFFESMDWLILVWDKIENLKGKGAPFCVHLLDRYWGCYIDYFIAGPYKPAQTIVATSIREDKELKEDFVNGGGSVLGKLFFADTKTEAVFISCYEFLKWYRKEAIKLANPV